MAGDHFSLLNTASRTALRGITAIKLANCAFSAIAIVGGKEGKMVGAFPPCGVCRQVMAEFCDPDSFKIYLGLPDGGHEEYTLRDLLPSGFFPSALDQ